MSPPAGPSLSSGETLMPNEQHRQNGRCLCGKVQFTAIIQHLEVGACHCSMCRRWSAGPFLYVECGDTLEFQASSCLRTYRSSAWAERGFCTQCGSPLFYRMLKTASYSVSAEAFDALNYQFTTQIFIDRKPSYYSFENETENTSEDMWFDWLRSNEA